DAPELSYEFWAKFVTWDLIMLWLSVISLSLLSSLLGRFLSYFFIFGIAKERKIEFIELNRQGINAISIHYFVSTVICSLLYCVILILMIENATLEKESLTTL
ncbi:unnamed protein product, partial [marine sediment metagenome]